MDEVIRFRTNKNEKKMIEAEAEKLGISVSAFLRLLIKNWGDGIKFERNKVAVETKER